MKTYNARYLNRTTTVEAYNIFDAHRIASEKFNAKDKHFVTVSLVREEDKS